MHSYQADEIWSANCLHTHVTMEMNMSTLPQALSHAFGNNQASFHDF